MPHYSYRATTQEGKYTQGTIESDSFEEAQHRLNDMGFSVIEIQESSEGGSRTESVFEFFAHDVQKSPIEGTIEAENEVIALKRLIEEFSLQPKWVVDASLPKSVKDSRRKNSIEIIQDKALELGISIQIPRSFTKETVVEFDAKFIAEQETLRKKIDTFLEIIQKILPVLLAKEPRKIPQIEEMVEGLKRIKMSNNLSHIEETATEILLAIIAVLETHETFMQQFQGEVIEMQTMFQQVSILPFQKIYKNIQGVFDSWVKTVSHFITKKTDQAISKEQELRIGLIQKRRNSFSLILYHVYGYIVHSLLRPKHKKALLKIWKDYTALGKELALVEKDLQNIQNFYSKEHIHTTFTHVYREIEFFVLSLLVFYGLSLSLLSFSYTKSLVFSPAFSYQMISSPLISSCIFALFSLYIFLSFGENLAKKMPVIVFVYIGMSLFFALLWFLNI